VRARVLLERRETATSVPSKAVFELEGKRFVYVLREGKARRVEIEVGLAGGDRSEILSGLTVDDRVLIDATGITEGLPIKPMGEPDVEREPEPEMPSEGKGKGKGKNRGWGGGGGRKR
jgi:membrane fusion protein, multidrug efflux system